jgi:hypothetical protein
MLALALLTGCCFHLIALEPFRKLPLDEQIRQFREGIRHDCLIREGGESLYLDAIAAHGLEAADAMTKLLINPDPDFPIEDVMHILTDVHTDGTDLRSHQCVQVLETIAQTTKDHYIRRLATRTLDTIRTFDPKSVRRSGRFP